MSIIFSFDPGMPVSKKRRIAIMHDDGIRLNGDNGSTVILIHGLTGTPNEMKYLAGYLNRKGYTVICPRLANHGEPMKVLKHTRWQEFYGSVRMVMKREDVAGSKDRIFAAGLSMGALLALLAADEFKGRISGVTCLAPTLFYDGWNAPLSRYFMPFSRTPIRYFLYFKEQPPYGIKNEAVRQRIHKFYGNASLDNMKNVAQYGYPFFPVTLLYQLQLLVKHITKKLPKMNFPVQLIHAKDDDMASIKNAKFIYDRVGSAIKEMVFLYDSYHVITADQERETVARKMAEFFESINGIPSSPPGRDRNFQDLKA